jgi:hypothetical protein
MMNMISTPTKHEHKITVDQLGPVTMTNVQNALEQRDEWGHTNTSAHHDADLEAEKVLTRNTSKPSILCARVLWIHIWRGSG